MDTSRLHFEAALAADRYDHATRLVYADWLEEHGHDDEAAWQRAWTPEWQRADDWLHDFAKTLGGSGDEDGEGWYGPYEEITYDKMMECARNWLENGAYSQDWRDPARQVWDGDYFIQLGSEQARNRMYEDGTKELFWKHYQTVTRTQVSEGKQGTVFSCSC